MLDGVDYIKATRYGKSAGVAGVPWHRRLVSLLGNAVARQLFGLPIHDLTNGFRAVRTSILAQLALTENGFAVIMEELCQAKPLARSYAEVPYVLTSRAAGQGRTHFTYDLKTYAGYLRYALKSARVRRPAA
jgi:dolichol-phosphate mannosyltransferase